VTEPTEPRSVPDVAGRDVRGASSPRGSLHAHRSAEGYHQVPRPLFLRELWARWARARDRHGA